MKGRDSMGKTFQAPRRGRRGTFAFLESIKIKARMLWMALRCTPEQMKRLSLRFLIALPLLWVLFDFVSYSYGTIPQRPAQISVTGLRHLSTELVRSEIFHKLRAQNADNLIEVDLPDLSEHLTRRIPGLRTVTMTMNVGRGHMSVVAVERKSIAIFSSPAGKLDVDREGVLYPSMPESGSGLPAVSGLAGSVMSAGRNLHEHPAGSGIVRLLTALPVSLSKQIKTIRVIRPEYIEISMADGLLVKVDPATFPAKMPHFQMALRKTRGPFLPAAGSGRAGAERREAAYIDLRFHQDVIKYRSEPPPAGVSNSGGSRNGP